MLRGLCCSSGNPRYCADKTILDSEVEVEHNATFETLLGSLQLLVPLSCKRHEVDSEAKGLIEQLYQY